MGRKSQQGVDWSIKSPDRGYATELRKFSKFLANEGYRESSVDCYVIFAGRYLKFGELPRPEGRGFPRHRQNLHHGYVM